MKLQASMNDVRDFLTCCCIPQARNFLVAYQTSRSCSNIPNPYELWQSDDHLEMKLIKLFVLLPYSSQNQIPMENKCQGRLLINASNMWIFNTQAQFVKNFIRRNHHIFNNICAFVLTNNTMSTNSGQTCQMWQNLNRYQAECPSKEVN